MPSSDDEQANIVDFVKRKTLMQFSEAALHGEGKSIEAALGFVLEGLDVESPSAVAEAAASEPIEFLCKLLLVDSKKKGITAFLAAVDNEQFVVQYLDKDTWSEVMRVPHKAMHAAFVAWLVAASFSTNQTNAGSVHCAMGNEVWIFDWLVLSNGSTLVRRLAMSATDQEG